MASLGFIDPPPKFRSPLDIKAPGPTLIYLVGLLAISDLHINICVGPPNTCVALKQFNLLLPNTLFWSNIIYYLLTHRFEAITLGWTKTCVKWFWNNFAWDWQTETWIIVNPIQDGGGRVKKTPTSFFPVTSTNVRFDPQNFLTFSFNPFVTQVQNFKFLPSPSPKLFNLNQNHHSKKAIFFGLVLIKLPLSYRSSHRNTTVTKLWSHL